jgi:hypothetical protein
MLTRRRGYMEKADFLKGSVDDCQSVIRALDAKCGGVVILLLAPVASFSKIFRAIEGLPGPLLARIFVGGVFFALWAVAAISVLRALSPLDNPADHIPDAKDFKGTYYRGGLYRLGFVDALFKRSNIVSSKSVTVAVADVPNSEEGIIRELTFEHMKLCYIRDVKSNLLSWGIAVAIVWLSLGMAIYLTWRYGR